MGSTLVKYEGESKAFFSEADSPANAAQVMLGTAALAGVMASSSG